MSGPDEQLGRVARLVERGVEAALPVARSRVDRLRRAGVTPQRALTRLETEYVAAVAVIGGGAGGLAALPGIGTAASLTAAGTEISLFVETTALYVLARALVQGEQLPDPAARRLLVLAVLAGEGTQGLVRGVLSRSGGQWGRRLSGINRRALERSLARRLLTGFGSRQGALALGRALPFGVGAAIGGAGNAALARGVVSRADQTFGPAPQAWTIAGTAH